MLVKWRYGITVGCAEAIYPREIDVELINREGVPIDFVSMTAGQTARLIKLLQKELAKFPPRKPRKPRKSKA